MPFLDGAQLWSFRGTVFAARLGSERDWDEWFEETTIMAVDPILDSQDRYVDIGGVTFGQVQRLAAFNTAADRDAFHAMRGTVGTLARPGRSRRALFVKSKLVSSGSNDFFLLDVAFEAA